MTFDEAYEVLKNIISMIFNTNFMIVQFKKFIT